MCLLKKKYINITVTSFQRLERLRVKDKDGEKELMILKCKIFYFFLHIWCFLDNYLTLTFSLLWSCPLLLSQSLMDSRRGMSDLNGRNCYAKFRVFFANFLENFHLSEQDFREISCFFWRIFGKIFICLNRIFLYITKFSI